MDIGDRLNIVPVIDGRLFMKRQSNERESRVRGRLGHLFHPIRRHSSPGSPEIGSLCPQQRTLLIPEPDRETDPQIRHGTGMDNTIQSNGTPPRVEILFNQRDEFQVSHANVGKTSAALFPLTWRLL